MSLCMRSTSASLETWRLTSVVVSFISRVRSVIRLACFRRIRSTPYLFSFDISKRRSWNLPEVFIRINDVFLEVLMCFSTIDGSEIYYRIFDFAMFDGETLAK